MKKLFLAALLILAPAFALAQQQPVCLPTVVDITATQYKFRPLGKTAVVIVNFSRLQALTPAGRAAELQDLLQWSVDVHTPLGELTSVDDPDGYNNPAEFNPNLVGHRFHSDDKGNPNSSNPLTHITERCTVPVVTWDGGLGEDFFDFTITWTSGQ